MQATHGMRGKMRKVGLVALILAMAMFIGMGQKASEDTVTLAIVAIVIVFGLVCALLAFFVHNAAQEGRAWAVRPSPPAVVYPPALPQAQQQPMVVVLPSAQAQTPQAKPQMVIIPQQLARLQGAMALPRGIVEEASQELPDLFYPRREE